MSKFILFMMVSVVFVVSCNVYAQDSTTCLLWKIEKEGLKISYLFGTIHVVDERVFNFSDSLMPVFDRTEVFAMEIHPDSLAKYLYDTKTSKSIENAVLDQINKQVLGESGNLSAETPITDDSEPEAKVTEEASQPESEQPVFLDMHLTMLAKKSGKLIRGLEDVALSAEMTQFAEQSETETEQVDTSDLPSATGYMENLINYYLDEDINALDQLYLDSSFIDPAWRNRAIIQRNYIQLASMDSLMKLYSVFFAVGTAHLPGKEGLIALLQEHGYKVSPVKAPKTGQYKDYELKRTQIEWRAYSDSKTGYRFELPVYASPLKIPNTTIVMYMINDMSTGINYSTLGRILAQEEILENENRTLQVFCEKYVTSIGLPLLESRSINEHGCLGVEMVIGSPNPRLKVKILMREHKYIYVIGVDGENMNLLDKNDIEHFFDSFELTRVQADDWNMFKSETGAFSARFPVTPNKSEYAVPGNEGNTITTNIFLANDTSGVTYMVNYFDMDIEDSSISDSAYLTNVITNAMVKMGSGDPEVSLGYKQTYPCASATSHFNGQTLRVSIYLKGKRTYMVMVQMPEGASTKGSEIFFVSFTFLE